MGAAIKLPVPSPKAAPAAKRKRRRYKHNATAQRLAYLARRTRAAEPWAVGSWSEPFDFDVGVYVFVQDWRRNFLVQGYVDRLVDLMAEQGIRIVGEADFSDRNGSTHVVLFEGDVHAREQVASYMRGVFAALNKRRPHLVRVT
jgi:hypothetical protein